jgi:hypothetical protein
MKSFFLTILASCLFFTAFSQNLPAIDDVKMNTKEDFITADAIALKTANYFLSTPSDPTNISKLKGTKFLLDWMRDTPNFRFSLEEDNMLNYFDKDMDELLGVYLASLTSATFENRTTKNSKVITLIAVKKFIAYIDNGSNKATMNSELKKLSQANQKNELKNLLKL